MGILNGLAYFENCSHFTLKVTIGTGMIWLAYKYKLGPFIGQIYAGKCVQLAISFHIDWSARRTISLLSITRRVHCTQYPIAPTHGPFQSYSSTPSFYTCRLTLLSSSLIAIALMYCILFKPQTQFVVICFIIYRGIRLAL